MSGFQCHIPLAWKGFLQVSLLGDLFDVSFGMIWEFPTIGDPNIVP